MFQNGNLKYSRTFCIEIDGFIYQVKKQLLQSLFSVLCKGLSIYNVITFKGRGQGGQKIVIFAYFQYLLHLRLLKGGGESKEFKNVHT